MQRNKLIVLSFLISLSVICQAQNFGWYESSQQLFGLQDYQPILNRISYLNLDSIEDIRGFRSITQYQNLQLSQLQYHIPSQINNLKVSETSIIGIINNSPITFNLTFDFVDQSLFSQIEGTGYALFQTESISISKTYVSANISKPTISCEIDVELQNISVSLVNYWNKTLTNADEFLNSFIISQMALNISSVLTQYCNENFANITWPTYFIYDGPLNAGISFSDKFSVLEFIPSGGIFTIDGSWLFNPAPSNQISADIFNNISSNVQYVLPQPFLQRLVNQFYLGGQSGSLFEWYLNSSTYPINGFDYTIDDISNIIPNVYGNSNYSPSSLCQLHAWFNSSPQISLIQGTSNININYTMEFTVFGPDWNILLSGNFNGGIIVNVQLRQDKLNLTVTKSNINLQTIQADKSLGSSEFSFLQYYIQSGISKLIGSGVPQGSGFNLPGVNLTSAFVTSTSNYMIFYN